MSQQWRRHRSTSFAVSLPGVVAGRAGDLICVLGLLSAGLFPSDAPLLCGRFRICIGRTTIFGRSSSSSICGREFCRAAFPDDALDGLALSVCSVPGLVEFFSIVIALAN
uniref:Uncharacterized protein n=1 Tax=Anopheles melas TaxID=34690 RepID=A0A182U989_9DIPT